jgi:hypothetical protein
LYQDGYAPIQMDITPHVIEAVNLQCTPELSRNYFVTGYSPDTVGLESSVSPTNGAGTSSGLLKTPGAYDNDVPSVPPHIQRLVREVSGMHKKTVVTSSHRPKRIPEVAGLHPPSYEEAEVPDVSARQVPPRAPPHAHPSSLSGLPPRAPRLSSKQQELPKKWTDQVSAGEEQT